MLIAIWDWLFTRRQWTIIDREDLYGKTWDSTEGKTGVVYTLQDQFGNIKKTLIKGR